MPFMTIPQNQPFSLDQTLACGQVFRWDRTADGWWTGVVGNCVIRIRQHGSRLEYTGASAPFIRHYFSLDVDLPRILASIDNDPVIHDAITRAHGLRLVRQPPWECTVSYICSTNSNIPTIRRRIAAIAETCGTSIASRETGRYSFPPPEAISCRGNDGLAVCRLGYRQPYVYGTACRIPDEVAWMKKIRKLPYEEGRKQLMTLHGIGPKAADCILLFAFQKYEAFPVDVWIRRIMQEHYLPDLPLNTPLSTREYETIRRFARDHFGDYCGWAQEYLYAGRDG